MSASPPPVAMHAREAAVSAEARGDYADSLLHWMAAVNACKGRHPAFVRDAEHRMRIVRKAYERTTTP